MKTLKIWSIALAGTVAISVSASAAGAEAFKRIQTEEEFRSAVVGKKLYLDDNHVTARKNGALTGEFGGQTLKGAWAWRDGYFCRTLSTHSKNTDCQLWTVNGNQHRITRERGKGKGFTYTAK